MFVEIVTSYIQNIVTRKKFCFAAVPQGFDQCYEDGRHRTTGCWGLPTNCWPVETGLGEGGPGPCQWGEY